MSVMDRLRDLGRYSSPLSPRQFDTESNTTGEFSTVANLTADTALGLKTGEENPVKLAVPAYESFTTAGDGTSQTFNLSNSLTESPDTQSVVVWFDGSYQGVPSSYDAANDTITVSGPGSTVTVHTFYISDDPATLKLVKSVPTAKTASSEKLFEANLSLVQQTNQSEQPEWIEANDSPLQRFLAADMDLTVKVKASYTIRFEDPDGDGATATNALLNFPAQQGEDTVPGLRSAIQADMGER